MDVRMEETAGLGREAQVWVDGHLLTVCDNVSRPGRRCPPGVLEDVRFAYMTAAGFTWAQAAAGNRSRRRQIDADRGWSYIGFGRVVDVMPVRVDFGLLVMEDANWTSDEGLVGRFVRVPIDRLEIAWADAADWPAETR